MKYLFLIAVFALCSITTKAQSIDTSACGFATVKITPIKVRFDDTVNAVFISCSVNNDNLSTNCTIVYRLLDAKCNVLSAGLLLLNGEDYKAWKGDNLYPFTYTATKKKLTLSK